MGRGRIHGRQRVDATACHRVSGSVSGSTSLAWRFDHATSIPSYQPGIAPLVSDGSSAFRPNGARSIKPGERPWAGVTNPSSPERAEYGSIPGIFLVPLNAVFSQQFAIFVFKTLIPVVLLLPCDVLLQCLHNGHAYREGAISGLPGMIGHMRSFMDNDLLKISKTIGTTFHLSS